MGWILTLLRKDSNVLRKQGPVVKSHLGKVELSKVKQASL